MAQRPKKKISKKGIQPGKDTKAEKKSVPAKTKKPEANTKRSSNLIFNKIGTWLKEKKAVVQFLLIFGLITASYYALLGTGLILGAVEVYSSVTVAVSAFILNIFGQNAAAQGNLLTTPASTLLIGMGCEGSEVMVMLLGAVIAFPVKWKYKLLGAAAGFVFLFLLNQLRVIGLYIADIHYKSSFDFFHEELFPLIFTILSIFYLVFWIKWTFSHREYEKNTEKQTAAA